MAAKRLWHPETAAEAYHLHVVSLNADVVAFAQIEADRAVAAMLAADDDKLHAARNYANRAIDVRDALLGATATYLKFRDAAQAGGTEPPTGGFT